MSDTPKERKDEGVMDNSKEGKKEVARLLERRKVKVMDNNEEDIEDKVTRMLAKVFQNAEF